MADGRIPRQRLDHLGLGEAVADEPAGLVAVEGAVGHRDDAGGLLAAVLERVQAERGEGGGVARAGDAEDAAFLAQAVVVRAHGLRRNLIDQGRSPVAHASSARAASDVGVVASLGKGSSGTQEWASRRPRSSQGRVSASSIQLGCDGGGKTNIKTR